MKAFDVFLGAVRVGALVGDAPGGGGGRSAFVPDADYLRLPRRPVLGQHFEDDPAATVGGAPGRLPAFFANLLPEGAVRDLLRASHGLAAGDDLGLLGAVGVDLPGAVVIRPSVKAAPPLPPVQEPDAATPDLGGGADRTLGLRFSIAGVQPKFSVLRDAERIALPAADRVGEWILKLDSVQYPNLVQNETATMTWARAAGFDVPACEARPFDDLPDALGRAAPAGRPFYLIERYDRRDGARIHQEDLAQVTGRYPECKYGREPEHPECPLMDVDRLVAVLRAVVGPDGYVEALRRLALMVATGNTDAHLKNWSVVYPDGVRAAMAPLYDQVAVCAWSEASQRWALDWRGTRGQPGRTRMQAFTDLASRLDEPADMAIDVVRDTLGRLAHAWSDEAIAALYTRDHAAAIRQYWRTVPLLRGVVQALP